MAKIDQIRKMLVREPDDLLLNYALAMELLNAGESEEALARFDKVIQIDPGYTAVYMQKAKALIDLARHDEARGVLEAGVRVAEQRSDLHARDKMEELFRAVR